MPSRGSNHRHVCVHVCSGGFTAAKGRTDWAEDPRPHIAGVDRFPAILLSDF
jgi:hypothetical protein